MSLYTERHGMRVPIVQTTSITGDMYSLLFDCCAKYYEYIAWKYPEECPDGRGCCGLNDEKMNIDMKFRIPSLYRYNDMISTPRKGWSSSEYEEFDQFALLDYIEFFAQNVTDVARRTWHSFFGHDDLSFADTTEVFDEFQKDINEVFKLTGLSYILTNDKTIERVAEHGVISPDVVKIVQSASESGTRELLMQALTLFKHRNPAERKNAVEKIWDALERVKTFYAAQGQKDKKASVEKVIKAMSGGQSEFEALFNAEFKALTDIGNNFRIRHHETYVTDIADDRHYDYFFNRCLSLIAFAIQAIESKNNNAPQVEQDDDLPF